MSVKETMVNIEPKQRLMLAQICKQLVSVYYAISNRKILCSEDHRSLAQRIARRQEQAGHAAREVRLAR